MNAALNRLAEKQSSSMVKMPRRLLSAPSVGAMEQRWGYGKKKGKKREKKNRGEAEEGVQRWNLEMGALERTTGDEPTGY